MMITKILYFPYSTCYHQSLPTTSSLQRYFSYVICVYKLYVDTLVLILARYLNPKHPSLEAHLSITSFYTNALLELTDKVLFQTSPNQYRTKIKLGRKAFREVLGNRAHILGQMGTYISLHLVSTNEKEKRKI